MYIESIRKDVYIYLFFILIRKYRFLNESQSFFWCAYAPGGLGPSIFSLIQEGEPLQSGVGKSVNRHLFVVLLK